MHPRLFSPLRRFVHVRTWTVPTAPGGTLKLRLPFTATVQIAPLSPHTSDWKSAQVSLSVLGETDDTFISEETAQAVATNKQMFVSADTQRGHSYVRVEGAEEEGTITSVARKLHQLRRWMGGVFKGEGTMFDARLGVDVLIPGKFDVDVEVEDGSIEVHEKIEGDVRILGGKAGIDVNNVKGTHIDIESVEGDIKAGVLQGKLSVRSHEGLVELGRVQGPSAKVVCGGSDVRVNALYATRATIRTREGGVKLGGAQGCTRIRTVEGDVLAVGVEGRLEVETDSGDVTIGLSVPEVVNVRSRSGDVTVGLAERKAEMMALGGAEVDVEEGVLRGVSREEGGKVLKGEVVGREDGEMGSVYIRAPNGDVVVRREEWGSKFGIAAESRQSATWVYSQRP